MARRLAALLVTGLFALALILLLGTRLTGMPPLGTLLDPVDGLYRTARNAEHADAGHLRLAALDAPVTVVRDERGVPHIFADSDRDAVVALGYVVAQDRLFQLDFIPRVASGRLASALGPSAVDTDRFLRSTGMEWGARRNLERMRREGGLEYDLLRWFSDGVNAYVDGLDAEDLPFEFRLIGYRPDRYSPLQSVRMMQYMAFDLSFNSRDALYTLLQERLSPEAYARLYPSFARLFVPIVPETGGMPSADRAVFEAGAAVPAGAVSAALAAHVAAREGLRGTVAEGYRYGKGSNNWAVAGARSATGAPLLAGDPHLGLSLPSIWYEVHVVTPTMNTYGVTLPGAQTPVIGFNDYAAWTFTNTGSDQLDHLALQLDATGLQYRYEDAWRPLVAMLDTIYVSGGDPVVDTLWYAHWGPVLREGDRATALRWVAHDANRTSLALWEMNHAQSYAAFQEALRLWDAPMQNVLYADVHGNIAIRSTGYLPLRRSGTGAGLRDGASEASAWIGRVPFDELPHSMNPEQGYLASANQQPADSTYPYYLGHDWRDAFRSLRINTLLRAKPQHTVGDMMRYQADVHALQHDLFAPLLDTLDGLGARADTLRRMLVAWDGETTVDRPEPLVLDVFLKTLDRLAWDEPAFEPDSVVNHLGEKVERRVPLPGETQLYLLMRDDPGSAWFDVQQTPEREDAAGLLRAALRATADTLEARHGWGAAHWRWGDHHEIVFRHLTRAPALRALGRGPFPFPGFAATLSPAGGRPTTHSASWRMVVDLSQQPPQGYGVYPGGQSGNPFSASYDRHLPTYLDFDYYDLQKPRRPEDLTARPTGSTLTLHP